MRTQTTKCFEGTGKTFAFTVEEGGSHGRILSSDVVRSDFDSNR